MVVVGIYPFLLTLVDVQLVVIPYDQPCIIIDHPLLSINQDKLGQ